MSLGEICVFCFGQLGNGLNLRILGGQPPEVWHPGDTPPDWVNALRDPSTGDLGQREKRPRERDRFGVPESTSMSEETPADQGTPPPAEGAPAADSGGGADQQPDFLLGVKPETSVVLIRESKNPAQPLTTEVRETESPPPDK